MFQADLIHSDTLSSCFSHKGEGGDETSRHSKTMQCSTHTDLEVGKKDNEENMLLNVLLIKPEPVTG